MIQYKRYGRCWYCFDTVNFELQKLSKKQLDYLYKSEIFTKQKSLVNNWIERVGIVPIGLDAPKNPVFMRVCRHLLILKSLMQHLLEKNFATDEIMISGFESRNCIKQFWLVALLIIKILFLKPCQNKKWFEPYKKCKIRNMISNYYVFYLILWKQKGMRQNDE